MLLLDRSRCLLGREHHIVWGVGERLREEIELGSLGDAILPEVDILTPLEIVTKMNIKTDSLCGYAEITTANWQDYVGTLKIELACGEAPFVTNEEGTGFLDRKLQAVNMYCDEAKDWLDWTKRAYRASYGYEINGVKLLAARRALCATFIKAWRAKFPGVDLCQEDLAEVAEIVTWNFFQMDGLTNMTPGRKLWAKTMDWQQHKIVEFRENML